jgi:hypothetical protein
MSNDELKIQVWHGAWGMEQGNEEDKRQKTKDKRKDAGNKITGVETRFIASMSEV